jgi:hypothetical protein
MALLSGGSTSWSSAGILSLRRDHPSLKLLKACLYWHSGARMKKLILIRVHCH